MIPNISTLTSILQISKTELLNVRTQHSNPFR